MNNNTNRDERGRFIAGNTAAEKWTEETAQELLQCMWETATRGLDDADFNPVRANDIKTLGELCLMNDIDTDTFSYLEEKFKDTYTVFRMIKKIRDIIEARLQYAGGAIDIFILKAKYKYQDRVGVDHTTNGKDLPAQEHPGIVFVPASEFTEEQRQEILNGYRK